MDNLTVENVVLRKLNENDNDLFISLRMDYYNIEETEQKQIENSLKNISMNIGKKE